MHDVQTCSLTGVPFTSARTRWMFGSQRRLVLRWEYDTFIPKPGCLPQILQTAATMTRHLDRITPAGTNGQVTIPAHGVVHGAGVRCTGRAWVCKAAGGTGRAGVTRDSIGRASIGDVFDRRCLGG
jgi:hypothetical protein